MKIELFDTGLSGCTIEGDITLSKYDKRTQDFELIMERNGLCIIEPTDNIQENGVDEWAWLSTYPIESIIIQEQTIIPTWKPNRFGEQADENAFQQVKLMDDKVILSVQANGTPKEVYDRYNPYISHETGNLVYKQPVDAVKDQEFVDQNSLEQQFVDLLSDDRDSVANHLFE